VIGLRKLQPYRINLKFKPGYRHKVDPAVLRAASRAALAQQGAPAPSELTLLIAGDQLYARDAEGHVFNIDDPTQALLMNAEELPLRPLTARERRRRTSGSEKLARGRRKGAE